MQHIENEDLVKDYVECDPAFGLDDSNSLLPNKKFNTPSGRRHLATRIARDHSDIQAHIQRIYLLLDSRDSEEMIFGALIDLFLALGAKGHELREAVLKIARPQLHEKDYQFLVQRLKNGLQRMDVLPASEDSVLDRAIFGRRYLVVRQRTKAPVVTDAVDIALMHLEDGDIKGACDVLESALLSDPANIAVEAELLEIYRRSRDDAGFLNMRKQLESAGATLGAEWDEL
jgi:hypothetical protein